MLIYYRQNDIVEKLWAANLALFFMFRLITLKWLNSLTLIYMTSCLGGLEVTQQAVVRVVPGTNPGYSNACYVCLFVFLLGCFDFFNQNTFFVMQFCKTNLQCKIIYLTTLQQNV